MQIHVKVFFLAKYDVLVFFISIKRSLICERSPHFNKHNISKSYSVPNKLEAITNLENQAIAFNFSYLLTANITYNSTQKAAPAAQPEGSTLNNKLASL